MDLPVSRLLLAGASVLAVVAAIGCGDDIPASEKGAALFRDPALSTSPFNRFACSTCHVVDQAAPATGRPGRIDPGFNLAGSARRPSWWGGDRVRLLDAINLCVTEFMGGRALTADEEPARQLYEYLLENSPAAAYPALPLTIVRDVTDLGINRGDPAAGQLVWTMACYRCHGAIGTGSGRLTDKAGIVPNDTIKTFGVEARAATVEKVRHGKFINIGGTMPFYAREVLSDQQLVDVLAFLGL